MSSYSFECKELVGKVIVHGSYCPCCTKQEDMPVYLITGVEEIGDQTVMMAIGLADGKAAQIPAGTFTWDVIADSLLEFMDYRAFKFGNKSDQDLHREVRQAREIVKKMREFKHFWEKL